MYKSYGEYHKAYPNEDETAEPERKYTFDLVSGKDLLAVLKQPGPEVIIVDAWAPWCRPCKKAGLKFEALGQKFEHYLLTKQLLLLKDNIDEEATSHHRPLVDVVPSFFVYVKGNLVHLFTGVDFDQLDQFVTSYFSQYSYRETPAPPQAQPSSIPPVRNLPQIKPTIQYPPKNI